jgi:hypothetical protein
VFLSNERRCRSAESFSLLVFMASPLNQAILSLNG